jgi:hypothetical protein
MSRSSLTPLSPVHVIPTSIHVYHAFSKVIDRLRHSKCVFLSLHLSDISSSSLLLAGGDALIQSDQQIVRKVNIITMVSNLL